MNSPSFFPSLPHDFPFGAAENPLPAQAIPGALLAICALCLVTNLPSYVTASQRQLPIYSVQRDHKVCALTFDAAWGNAILRHSLKR